MHGRGNGSVESEGEGKGAVNTAAAFDNCSECKIDMKSAFNLLPRKNLFRLDRAPELKDLRSGEVDDEEDRAMGATGFKHCGSCTA